MTQKKLTSSVKKILSPKRAAIWVRAKQKKGHKIVFTNGCFDLIHSGHVTYLEEARKLGHGLIVALNGDASVRKLKGKSRPLNTLADRARVMAALGCVDAVTWFTEETPQKIIDALLPKILVKGGDWPVEKMVGAQTVLAHGGKVKSLRYIAGKSTTNIIKKMKAAK